jgi:hypothetical protein
MPNQIRHKRTEAGGRRPVASQLALGELAINAADGKVFLKRSDNAVVTPVPDFVDGGDILPVVSGVRVRYSYDGAMFNFHPDADVFPTDSSPAPGPVLDAVEFRVQELNPLAESPATATESFDFNDAADWDDARFTFRNDGFGLGQIRYTNVLDTLMDAINLPEFRWLTGAAGNGTDERMILKYNGTLTAYRGFRLTAFAVDAQSVAVVYLMQAVLLDNQLLVTDSFFSGPGYDDPPSPPSYQDFEDATAAFFGLPQNLDSDSAVETALAAYDAAVPYIWTG